MQRLSNWAAWIAVIAVAGLAALNLNTLSTPAPIDLLVGRIEAPLGLVLLGLVAVAVFAAVAYLAYTLLGSGTKQVAVPRVTGLTQAQAVSRPVIVAIRLL